MPLVERDVRRLRLTASGQAYSVYARAILGLHEEGSRSPAPTVTQSAAGSGSPRPPPQTPARRVALLPTHHPAVDLRLRSAAASGSGGCSPRTSKPILVFGCLTAGPRSRRGDPRHEIEPARCRRVPRRRPPTSTSAELGGCSARPARSPGPPARPLSRPLRYPPRAHPGYLFAGPCRLRRGRPRATLVSRDAVSRQLKNGDLIEVAVPGTSAARPWHAVTHGRQPAPSRCSCGTCSTARDGSRAMQRHDTRPVRDN